MWVDPKKVVEIQTLADKLALLPYEVLLYLDGATDMALAMVMAQKFLTTSPSARVTDMAMELVKSQANQQK